MSLSNVHSDLNDIVAFDEVEQQNVTGWDVPDYSNDRVVAPADRAAFLGSFNKRYVTRNHWHNLTKRKELMLDCMTLVTLFERDEVVQFVSPTRYNSTRPDQMHRAPTPNSRGDFQASLSYAVTTSHNHGISVSDNIVVVEENSGREIHMAASPDALTNFDLLTEGVQFLKDNDGKNKSGKALFDLVASRCINYKMYCQRSKCDKSDVFIRDRAHISLVLSTTRTMTGHNEGLMGLLFLDFRHGLNVKPEDYLTAGSNDKTTIWRPSSIYFNTIHDDITHETYQLIMKGHKFCYKKSAAWYDRLFELREMEIDELQAIVNSIGADVSACPVATTEKGTLVLAILTEEIGNAPPTASSSSAGAARSTSSTRTSSGTSSSNTSTRRQSLESRRREINNLSYPVLESPFTDSAMSEMVTTIVRPSARELELDRVVALIPIETLCAIFRLNNWSVAFAECLNEEILSGEDVGIANIALFGSDELVKNNGIDDESGGELAIAAIELRMELLSDWAPSTQIVSSTQVTQFVWMKRAHIHKQQYCRSSKYLVPSSGGSRSGDMSANADYTPLRDWLYCIIQDPHYNGPQYGEIPEPGSPVYNLLVDIGVCFNPTLFRSLVEESTADNAVSQVSEDAKKRRLTDTEQSRANAAASGLLAKFGRRG